MTYCGSELSLFRDARNWKSYYGAMLQPLLGRRVLEVGAGLGALTERLAAPGAHDQWLCLEPDPALSLHIGTLLAGGTLPGYCEVQVGTLADVEATAQFDSILYIDVLEHIADDVSELELAAKRLAPGGKLIVLVPAHQWLFSPFDESIGHFRRYSRPRLRRAAPKHLREVSLRYLDSVGLSASMANRLLLQQAMPGRRQIAFWDRCLVPLSTRLDGALRHCVGKSVLGVWEKAIS